MPRLVLFLLVLLSAFPAAAQIKCSEGMDGIERDADSRISARDFIKDVQTNEAVFGKAFAGYGYKLEVTLQTLLGDTVDGEYRRTSVVDFDDQGQPREKVIDGPVNTLSRLRVGDREFDRLREAFTLVASKVSDNDVVYAGRQRIGDINTAVFDIMPRDQAADISGFEGRVWVRIRDNAIMHICGRSSSSPIAPMRFDVTRAPIDEKYWFPVLIRADEEARVGNATVHVRLTARYSDYKAR